MLIYDEARKDLAELREMIMLLEAEQECSGSSDPKQIEQQDTFEKEEKNGDLPTHHAAVIPISCLRHSIRLPFYTAGFE